jgi:hypothetical protein
MKVLYPNAKPVHLIAAGDVIMTGQLFEKQDLSSGA